MFKDLNRIIWCIDVLIAVVSLSGKTILCSFLIFENNIFLTVRQIFLISNQAKQKYYQYSLVYLGLF
jgi:hypothetical protein